MNWLHCCRWVPRFRNVFLWVPHCPVCPKLEPRQTETRTGRRGWGDGRVQRLPETSTRTTGPPRSLGFRRSRGGPYDQVSSSDLGSFTFRNSRGVTGLHSSQAPTFDLRLIRRYRLYPRPWGGSLFRRSLRLFCGGVLTFHPEIGCHYRWPRERR